MQVACGSKASGTSTGNITFTVPFVPEFFLFVVTGAADGGGCGEAEVWQEAMETMADGRPRTVVVTVPVHAKSIRSQNAENAAATEGMDE